MNYWESHTQVAVRFRRFDRKRYAAFRSMHKVINIGVVTASTLLFALPDTAQAQKVIEPNRTGEECFRRAGRGRSYRLPCAYRTESSDQDRDSHSRP